jgi:hypothetical protein
MPKLVWIKLQQNAVVGVEMWRALSPTYSFLIIKDAYGFVCSRRNLVTELPAFPDFKKYHSSLGEAQKVCQDWADKLGV